jgi:hypothetical protein
MDTKHDLFGYPVVDVYANVFSDGRRDVIEWV